MTSHLHRTYRKIRYGEAIIVVSGLPRSGTSMIMKMLEAGGMRMFTDGVRTADDDNPKGYYEYERVKDLVKERDKSWLTGARGKVIKIISYLLKELPEINNYKVLFMRRNLHEIIASQNKMLARRGESPASSDERMIELFEQHLRKVNYLIKHATHLEAIDLHYKEVLENPLGQAVRISDFLGGQMDAARVAGAVDKQLYRNRA